MDVVTNNYMPGDPRLIDQIVYELKSQGIFDQFRKECISDVDTKPAYQNLRQRVEGSVTNFLDKLCWKPDMNKNQVREQLRKTIYESGYLETGVERIVDQVVNPKINSVFLPKVEEIVYRFLGIEKPNKSEPQKSPEKKPQKIDVADLLPTDLEAVSPESVNDDHSVLNDDFKADEINYDTVKDDSFNSFENHDSSSKADEDESPPFEPLDEPISVFVHQEENSVDSNLSGFSGLASHDSNNSFNAPKLKTNPAELNNDSQISQNSSDGRLSIITSESANSKMEISEDSQEKDLNNFDKKIEAEKFQEKMEVDYSIIVQKVESKKNDIIDDIEVKREDLFKEEDNIEEQKEDIKIEEKKVEDKIEDKKVEENKEKKSRSSDKHKSSKRDKDKIEEKAKDHSDHKSKEKRSSSTGKDKDKDRAKDSSSKSLKDREHKSSSKHSNKDKKEPSSGSRDKDKDKREKDKAVRIKTGEKDKEKSGKSSRDKVKNEKDSKHSDKDKSNTKEKKDKDNKDKDNKEKRDKEKSEKIPKDKERDRGDKENNKDKGDKDNSKIKDDKDDSKVRDDKHKDKKSKSSTSRSNSISSSKKESSSSGSSKKEDKDKDKPRSSSSSHNKDKDKNNKDKEKKSSSEKHKKTEKDKDSHSVSSQNTSKHVSSKKDKDKEKDKKSSKDDHYGSKDKKRERRSTDRDSNDGSGKMSRNSSFTENPNTYSAEKKAVKENSFSSGSSGDSSGNSDQIEKSVESVEAVKIETMAQAQEQVPFTEVMQKFKYIKPKFASNMKEAIKLMKIRKELAKLERQNQLALAEVKANNINMDHIDEIRLGADNVTPVIVENGVHVEEKIELVKPEKREENTKQMPVSDEEPMLQSTDLSPERWEELEARLAEEMSLVSSKSYYGWDEDDADVYETDMQNTVKDKDMNEVNKYNEKDVNEDKSKDLNISEGKDKKVQLSTDKKEIHQDKLKDKSETLKIHKENEALNRAFEDQIKKIDKKRKLSGDKTSADKGKEINKSSERRSPVKKEDSKSLKIIIVNKNAIKKEFDTSPKGKNKRRKISEDKNILNRDNKTTHKIIELPMGKKEHVTADVEVNIEKPHDKEAFDKAAPKKTHKERKISTIDKNNHASLSKLENKCGAVNIGENKHNVKTILKHVIKNRDRQKRISGGRSEIDKASIMEKSNSGNIRISESKNNLNKNLKVVIAKRGTKGLKSPLKNGKKDTRLLVVHLEKLQGYNGKSLLQSSDISEETKDNGEIEIKDTIEGNDLFEDGFHGFSEKDNQDYNGLVLEEIITDQNSEEMNSNIIVVDEESKFDENFVIEESVLMDDDICTEIINEDILFTEDEESILLPEENKVMFEKTEESSEVKANEVAPEVAQGPMVIVEDDASLELSEEELEEIKNLAVNNEEGAIVCELELAYDEQNAHDQILFKLKGEANNFANNNGSLQELKIEFDPKDTYCRYLERPTVQEEKKLQTIHEFIGILERNVEELSLKIHNNIPKVVEKVRRKRKVMDDAKNNNKAAKRSRQSSVNSENLSKSDKEGHLCNSSSTDISLNGSFSLPLSPADSDKDLDNKTGESAIPVKTKRILNRVPVEKRQCYSSDDLYKPRPVFSVSSRRCRGSRQIEEN